MVRFKPVTNTTVTVHEPVLLGSALEDEVEVTVQVEVEVGSNDAECGDAWIESIHDLRSDMDVVSYGEWVVGESIGDAQAGHIDWDEVAQKGAARAHDENEARYEDACEAEAERRREKEWDR